MAVQPDTSPTSTDDLILAIRLHQLRVDYPETVRTVAGRWVEGLRALLGLAATIGVIGGPLASDRLSGTARTVVGVLIVAVLVVGGIGLLRSMAAAYGSLGDDARPNTLGQLESMRRAAGKRAGEHIIWGRRLATVALGLLAGAVAVAWLDPWKIDEPVIIAVETNDGSLQCGTPVDGPDGHITLEEDGVRQVPIDAATIESLDVADNNECGG